MKILGNCTLFSQFYVSCTKEVFSHLQVYLLYLVIYYIKELAHESVLLLSSKHKIVNSRDNLEKIIEIRKKVGIQYFD